MGVHIYKTVSPSVNMTIYYKKGNILCPNSWPFMSASLGYVKLEVICFTCFGAIAVTRKHNTFSSSSFVVYGVLNLF